MLLNKPSPPTTNYRFACPQDFHRWMGSHFMWWKYRFLHGKCWHSTFTHEFVFTKQTSEALQAIEFCENKRVCTVQARPRALQHCTHVSWVEICHIAHKFHKKNTRETLVWKNTCKNTLENTCKFPNLHVKRYMHIVIICVYLVYLSSNSAGWASAVVLVWVAFLAKIKLSRHIQMLAFYVIWAKSDPSFLTEWTLFLNI